MSHNTGTIQTITPITIGPDSGDPPSAPNTWELDFAHTPAPGGTKFIILHFLNANLPADNRLEVDLGYDTDIFNSADGAEFWTRPVNIHAFTGGNVPIRYIIDGAGAGSVQLDRYGRGESLPGDPDHPSISNSDPFLPDANFTEPTYDPFWFCNTPPNWENVACIPGGDIRATVAQSVGMIVTVHDSGVSTCSVTCIAPDLVLTAGHCLPDPSTEIASSSVIFNYETECGGGTPPGYAGKFFKVIKLHKYRFDLGVADYAILQLKTPPGGIGVPALTMSNALPGIGEQIFGIHHPNGAVKKLSSSSPGFETVNSSGSTSIQVDFDVSGGSSGSGLFDTAGQVIGVLSFGTDCNLNYHPTATLLNEIATTPEPPSSRDVMLVFDRSGSMAGSAGTGGASKMEEARDAASLFVQLIRTGGGNRVGLVSFSSSASNPVDFDLSAVNNPTKTALIGPAPYSAGVVGDLLPGGSTTIGGGLDAARVQLGAGGPDPRTILLLTDGLQNTPPMISDIEGSLNGIDISAIGFGTESSLNGELLSQLSENHNGLYTRAGTGLELRKFFALAFGDIFEAGALLDPEGVLPRDQNEIKPIPFNVCGENIITVIVGWDKPEAELTLRLKTPSGAIIDLNSAGVEHATGRTWMFLRIQLPYNSDRDGTWQATAFRPEFSGEFPPSPLEVQYFVNIIATGGASLKRVLPPKHRLYTGDLINPSVTAQYADQSIPHNLKIQLTVTRPSDSAGNLLREVKLGASKNSNEDTIPARYATLMKIEDETQKPVITYETENFELHDDSRNKLGTFERGVFGNPLPELLKTEGNYTFHARASYGDGCLSTRELRWSIFVDTGIDPGQTQVNTEVVETHPGGGQVVQVTFIPRDKIGNYLGPGRADSVTVTDSPGSTTDGKLKDNGDGSYTTTIAWDSDSGYPPGVVVTQPDRPSVVLQPGPRANQNHCTLWKIIAAILGFLLLILLLRF